MTDQFNFSQLSRARAGIGRDIQTVVLIGDAVVESVAVGLKAGGKVLATARVQSGPAGTVVRTLYLPVHRIAGFRIVRRGQRIGVDHRRLAEVVGDPAGRSEGQPFAVRGVVERFGPVLVRRIFTGGRDAAGVGGCQIGAAAAGRGRA